MNIKRKISDMKLSNKIGGSFVLVVLLMLIGYSASWFSLKSLSFGSSRFVEYTKYMMLCNQLQDALLQARMKAVEYSYSGTSSSLALYEKNIGIFNDYLAQIKVAFGAGEKSELIEEIKGYSSQYNSIFMKMADFEILRQKAVEDMNEIAPSILSSIEKISDEFAKNGDDKMLEELDALEILLLRSRIVEMRAVNEETEESYSLFKESIEHLNQEMDLLSSKFENDKLQADWNRLEGEIRVYEEEFDILIHAVKDRLSQIDNGLRIVGPKLSGNLEKLALSVKEDVNRLGAELNRKSGMAVSAILIISLISIAFAILVSVVLSKMILRPIRKVVEFSELLANGDLTAKISVDQMDEVGQMSKSLENMGTALKEQFGEMKKGVADLTSSASDLSAISNQLTTNAHDSEDVSHTVAAAAEESSHNMGTIAAAVEEMSSNIRTVATASEEMTSTINEISKNADQARTITMDAVQRVERTSNRMQELERAADLIGSVTDTISGISAQTNLLALNATIEAASAGEAGKGFAVVANEIKELSRQTNEATIKISESISGIQTSTKTSSTEIGGIVEIINEISSITNMIASAVEEQSASTSEIASNITQTSDGVQEITNSVTDVSRVAHDTTREIMKVSDTSKEIAGASDNLNVRANEIARFSERLNGIVSQYKVS